MVAFGMVEAAGPRTQHPGGVSGLDKAGGFYRAGRGEGPSSGKENTVRDYSGECAFRSSFPCLKLPTAGWGEAGDLGRSSGQREQVKALG